MAEWPSFYGATTDKACLFVFFLRPKRGKESLSEFLEPDESDADIARPFFNGHNRWVDTVKTKSANYENS